MKRELRSLFVLSICLFFSNSVFAATPFRGELVQATSVGVLSAENLTVLKEQFHIKGFPRIIYGVRFHKVIYRTPDLTGQLSLASGMVIEPLLFPKRPLPLISYQHGTKTKREDGPSNRSNRETLLSAIVYASGGYAVVLADYLGLGVSPGLHPYLHVETQASSTVDMLDAGIALFDQLEIKLTGEIFLAGYSQGGHVTAALLKKMEELKRPVIAAAPMAGPYDLSDLSVKGAFTKPSVSTTSYAAYLVLAMNNVYKLYSSLREVVQEKYADHLPDLFDGTHDLAEITRALPRRPEGLFQSTFIQSVLNNPNDTFYLALKKNNLYDWAPVTPVRFYHGTKDLDVPYEVSVKTYQHMKALGANVELIDMGPLNHIAAAIPSLLASRKWFDELRGNRVQVVSAPFLFFPLAQ